MQVLPEGAPAQMVRMLPVSPLTGVSVTCVVKVWPATTSEDGCAMESVKSCLLPPMMTIGEAGLIVWTSVGDMPSKGPGAAPAWYEAVMPWSPTARAVVVKLAAEFTRGTVARGVGPSLKVTIPPLTAPPSARVTLATSVTSFVTVCGLAELVSTTVLWESTIFSSTAADCEAAKFVSPP